MNQIQTAVLAGGHSRRMGQDKAMLLSEGSTFLSMAVQKFSDKEDIFVSVRKEQKYPIDAEDGWSFVEDQVADCGPMGALLSLLNRACTSSSADGKKWDALFIFAVDMPFADRHLKDELTSFFYPGIDAVVPVTKDGRIHPLCAIYRLDILPVVKKQILEKNFRMQEMLKKIRVCYVPAEKLTDGEYKLQNINTKEEYEKVRDSFQKREIDEKREINEKPEIHKNRFGIPIISVAAYSGSGKTTFIEKLISYLTDQGYKIAVLKHDGHDFDADKKGKDTWRFAKAGASRVILISETKCVTWEYYPKEAMAAIDEIQDADLILVEGLKHWPFRKALLYREAAGKPPAFDPDKTLPVMIISDMDIWPDVQCPKIDLNDIAGAADICESYINGEIK